MYTSFLFIGLTHIGQVYSICWAKKFGQSNVYDFDSNRLLNFQNGIITSEEPDLKKLYQNYKNKIKIINRENIKNFKNIFFTIDTSLDSAGIPSTKEVKKLLEKLSIYIAKESNLIISSQVPPGFCRNIYNKRFAKKKINLIYMVDTLEMGNAIKKFLFPKMIVFGVNKKKNSILNAFKKFNAPIFVKKYEEAEIFKMSINLFLACSVSFANSIDYFCKQFDFNFSSLTDALRLDKRIGKFAYIIPSLGLSGGHLERDINYIVNNAQNSDVKNKFKQILNIEKSRIYLLIDYVKKTLKNSKKINKIIWLGISYKKNSFSLKNSHYNFFKKVFGKKVFNYDSYFAEENTSFFDLKKEKIDNSILIYNYLSEKDLKILKKKISNSKNTNIVNISFDKLKFTSKHIT
jgi:UDPglucose 6-dehydrogenase